MNSITITKLKTNPAAAILKAANVPVAVKKRDKVKAYLIGKDLYENLISYIEDYIDSAAIHNTDFSKGKSFEKVARELGI